MKGYIVIKKATPTSSASIRNIFNLKDSKKYSEYPVQRIVLLDDSGIEIENQSGGSACHHSVAKGFLLELYSGDYEIFNKLEHISAHFNDTWLCCNVVPRDDPWEGLTIEHANWINNILKEFEGEVKLDMSKLDKSEQAFYYIIYNGKPAVLMCEN